MINSEISQYIRLRPQLLECQVDVIKDEHRFLEWDSFVNCIEAHQAFDLNVVKEKIARNFRDILKGEIVDYCMRDIYRGVEKTVVMTGRHKRLILAAMTAYK